MERTLVASFATRREAELSVERLVQEYGVERTDIFIQPVGDANSAGAEVAGADLERGHPGVEKRGEPKLEGAIAVSVDCHGDQAGAVEAALREAGAVDLRSR